MLDFYRRLAEAYGALATWAKVLLIAGLFVVTTVFAMALVVLLPADHFSGAPGGPPPWWRRHPVLRWTFLVLKNALGLIVLPLGIAMALPFVPGPGLVFILIGLSLLDFPGKRRLERALLGRPSVLRFLNDLRGQFGKPPLIIDPQPRPQAK